LASKTLEGRRDFVLFKIPPYHTIFSPFHEVHFGLNDEDHLHFPANKYEDPAIHTKLSDMLAAEQPSHGWKWICDKHNIESLGIGTSWNDAFWEDDLPYRYSLWTDTAIDELTLGFPFWDQKRLMEWGVVIKRA
jgi:hypothetical protein